MTRTTRIGAILVTGLALVGAGGCSSGDDDGGDDAPAAVRLDRVDLVSDQAGAALRVDPDVVNAWGIAYGPETAFWVADAGTARTSVLDGDGRAVLPSVPLGGEVTGVAYNPSIDAFVISTGQRSGPATFVYATTGGQLIGWSEAVAPLAGVVAYDGSANGAAYTGLAVAGDPLFGLRLYAANFAAGRVDVFDETFTVIQGVTPMFIDPGLPAGYVPFGVQALEGKIYVAYALQDPEDPAEEVLGAGLGVVSAFLPDGRFDHRVMTAGELNAPWAISRAPDSFGRFAGALLIGNFGDGRILAVDDDTGRLIGALDHEGTPIAIEGLWGLTPGNDRLAGRSDTLYFAAGPGDETHGLFGRIEAHAIAGGGGGGGGDDGGDDDPY